MLTIGELINNLKSRPGMYLGERSIDNLRSFLEGWMIARSPNRGDSEFMMGFQKSDSKIGMTSVRHNLGRTLLHSTLRIGLRRSTRRSTS